MGERVTFLVSDMVPYLERLTTMLSSIWTSLTLFSMGVNRSDLRGGSTAL